jgi:hypothetical protein
MRILEENMALQRSRRRTVSLQTEAAASSNQNWIQTKPNQTKRSSSLAACNSNWCTIAPSRLFSSQCLIKQRTSGAMHVAC